MTVPRKDAATNGVKPAANLTPMQERAARATGSVAVTAGAGTGKTHMLAHRYLHHLESGLSPLQIVAVTFTERAAAELRARIRRYVTREPDLAHHLVELEAAPISTLHALASRICREHPTEADVPADFAILEGARGAVQSAQWLEAAVAELPAGLTERLPHWRRKDLLASLLADPYRSDLAFANDPAAWRETLERERRSVIDAVLADEAWSSHSTTLARLAGPDDDKGEQARALCLEAVRALEDGQPARALECVKGYRTNAGAARNWPADDLAALRESITALKRTIEATCGGRGPLALEYGPADEMLVAFTHDLRDAYRAARERIAREKRRARVLDFADLEVHALRALEHEHVRAYYGARWRAVLVDEFQDTNPIQAAILDRLTERAHVTIVGDEKQSIYGFRGADPLGFRRYRQRITAGGGDEVSLDTSFRTHASIVGTWNHAFREILPDLHEPLNAARTEAPHDAPHVSLHLVEGTKGAPRAQRGVTEAHMVADLVLSLVSEGTTIVDPETAETRPVRFGDIAVLARSWRPLDTYGEILPGRGVRAVNTGGGNLLDTREAKDALALLRFLADPDDDVALAAVARSPHFAIDDTALVRFAAGIPRPARAERDAGERPTPWWRHLENTLEEEASAPFRRLHDVLAEALAARPRAAPSRLLQIVDERTGYGAVIANLPGAERRVADLRGVHAFVRELEAGLQDTFSVVRRVRQLLGLEIEIPRPGLRAGDAVTLTTIHRAKGLEWPVVIVADLDSSGGRAPSAYIEPEYGVALKLDEDDGSTVEPTLYSFLAERRKALEEEESRRVLYVALTRARDRVFLTAAGTTGGALKLLGDALERAEVPRALLPHDPAAAVYPDPPLPTDDDTSLRTDGAALWRLGATALGLAPRATHTQADDHPTDDALPNDQTAIRPVEGDWEESLEFVAEEYPEWLELARALQDAGLPPPDPDGVGRTLMVGGETTNDTSILSWRLHDAQIDLVPAATPKRRFDSIAVRAEPDADPGEILAALAPHVGESPHVGEPPRRGTS